ncbi:MAG TPA: glycosyltransferase [Polyangiales bacterium]|nr:glycosyltransferase [Polyangiales bacterium]
MNIILCYGYVPYTTGVYFERALQRQHDVYVVCPPWGDRLGRSRNEDVYALVEMRVIPPPDLVIWIESGIKFFPRGLEKFSCPTVGYLIDVHSGLWVRENYAPFFDHICIAHKDYVEHFQRLGYENVRWMPVGCDPEIHGQVPAERIYDVGFVGNLAPNANRRSMLEALERRYKLNDFRKAYSKEELTQVYSRSKLVFNYSTNADITMRVFEATAAGALLVSNHMDNGIDDLLRVGEHYVEFSDERSLLELVEYYLTHDAERERIAQAGQRAVLDHHTYDDRVRWLIETVRSAPAGARPAKVRSMSPAELRAAYGKIFSASRLVDAAFDEFDVAWQEKRGRVTAATLLGKTILRRLNSTMKLSYLLRGRPGR